MTAPLLAAQRFGMACLLGAGLGIVYGFLRPLRPKYTAISDLLFLLILAWNLVFLAFGICRGEFRFSYLSGIVLGGVCWELGPGQGLRGIWAGFWKIVGKTWGFLLIPVKNFFKFVKKCLHLGKNGLQ